MSERWVVDSQPSGRYPIWTRANVGEVVPEPVAPLSGTIGVISNAEPGWRDAFERFGAFTPDEFDPENIECIGVFGGYCYLNVTIARILGVRTPGLTPEAIDYQFFGEQPGVPPYEPMEGDENPALTDKVNQTLGWILTTDGLPELLDDQRLTEDLRTNRPDHTQSTDAELVAYMRSVINDHFRRLFATHIFITYAATVPAGIITTVSQEMGKPELALRLMSGVGDVDSAAPSWKLWEMSRLVAESDALSDIFDAGTETVIEQLQVSKDPSAGRFLGQLDAFMAEFGSRGPNEWEMRSATWETRPELALAAIDRMRLAGDEGAPALHQRERAEERQALGAQIVEALAGNPEVQQQFQAALRSATIFLAGRERTKTNAIRLLHEGRVAMHEFGRRMVASGHFEEPEDFGMLREDELEPFMADPGSFVETIRERKRRHAELLQLEPPFVFKGDPPAPETWQRRDELPTDKATAGTVMQGIPGCPGKASGRARVILDPSDPTALEPGDILVAPITDPAWTPLFVPAAGVVVDVGAPLSHAVIVSRELGIPCVVSVMDGTRRIPDGAMITVDGDTGQVTIDSPS